LVHPTIELEVTTVVTMAATMARTTRVPVADFHISNGCILFVHRCGRHRLFVGGLEYLDVIEQRRGRPMRELEALSRAVDAVQQADYSALPDGVMCEQVQELRRQIDRLESVFTSQVGLMHERGSANSEGYMCTAAYLRHACKLTAGAARGRVGTAGLLNRWPLVAAAFAEGAISYPHAAMVTSTLAELPAAIAADAQPVLVEAAKLLDTRRLAQAAQRLRRIMDPDGQGGLDERHYEQRWLEVRATFEGTVAINGVLDAESGAVVLTALEALMGPPAPDDERTGSQRRADALVDLARGELDHGNLPDVGGERPHVLVVSTLEGLRGDPGAQPAELTWGGPLGNDTSRRLACDPVVTRVVTTEPSGSLRIENVGRRAHRNGGGGPPGHDLAISKLLLDALPPQLRGPCQPLDVGRSERLATAPMRKALLIRDRGCAASGCYVPPGRLEAHHILHWIDGGPTAVWNLVLLCRRHHRFVHERGWRVALNDDGSIEFSPPPLAMTG
jgi:hypothetical protein